MEMRVHPSLAAAGHSVPVLFLIDELIEMGGAERALMRMIQHLPRERFTPTAITFRADLEQPLVRAFPCPLTVMPLGRTYNWNALQVARRIRAHIRQHGIQLVHTFFETSDLWGGLVAKSTGQVALISSRRDMGILRSRKHAIAYRLLNPLFDRVVAVSDRVSEYCREVDGLPAERVVTVYNGIEDRTSATVAREEIRAGMGLGADDLVITTVGHIRHVKGIDVLAEAAARLRERFPTARIAVVGDAHEPDHMAALQAYVASQGLERTLRFVGAREDIPAVLAASDIFVLPSRSEGFSNALVEAMLCSLPCVATDVGGNREAVREGVSGFLVASEAAGQLAERLAALLGAPALRARMGREGRRIALATFTVQGMMDGLMDVYDAALGARRKAR